MESTAERAKTAHAPPHHVRSEKSLEGAPSRLSGSEREEVVRHLNTLLADEYVLFTKVLNYHWNILGMQFHSFHAFLEDHYRQILEVADDVAERIRTVGGVPLGSMAQFMKVARLVEDSGEPPEPKIMISRLLHDHAVILERLRRDLDAFLDKYDDAGTSNFLMNLVEKQEKLAWMLRVHLAA
jgi:starvation-inducible DNA-binding protein